MVRIWIAPEGAANSGDTSPAAPPVPRVVAGFVISVMARPRRARWWSRS
jgi:hypothetical protein